MRSHDDYKQGMLRSAVALSGKQREAVEDALDFDYDYEKLPPSDTAEYAGERVAWLPHQCSYWVIGDVAAMKALRDDLQAAIDAASDPELP